MNAPPKIDPVSDSDVVHWLTNGTRDERFIDNIFAEMCVRLQRAGIPVKRATLHVLIQHPQWLGAKILWADGMREAELTRVDHDVRVRSEYIGSPANEIHDGCHRGARESRTRSRARPQVTPSMTRCGRWA